jgi:hypothetical protein
MFGWRKTLMFSGCLGLVISAMVKIFVPEPARKVCEPIIEEDEESCSLDSLNIDEEVSLLTCFSDLLKRPITKWMTISASL